MTRPLWKREREAKQKVGKRVQWKIQSRARKTERESTEVREKDSAREGERETAATLICLSVNKLYVPAPLVWKCIYKLKDPGALPLAPNVGQFQGFKPGGRLVPGWPRVPQTTPPHTHPPSATLPGPPPACPALQSMVPQSLLCPYAVSHPTMPTEFKLGLSGQNIKKLGKAFRKPLRREQASEWASARMFLVLTGKCLK